MKKKWMSGALALLLAGTTVASMVPAVAVNAEGQDTATGTTYYVDSKSGSDSNDGTSESKAFKTLDKVNALDLEPGDTVLLKKGSVFEDQALQFTKEDSGTAEAPVKISTYGEGDKPQINTNGHGQWEQNYGVALDNSNHKWHGTVSSSILIMDTEYIEIEGLELTNDRNSATDTEKDKTYNDAYAMDRTGVAGALEGSYYLEDEEGDMSGLRGDQEAIQHLIIDRINEKNREILEDITLKDLGEAFEVGMKSRGVYETPGGTILMAAHEQLEELVLDRATYEVKKDLGNKFAQIVYEGKWYTPLREAIQAFVDVTQQYVTGEVKFRLYKGNIIRAGETSPYSLYSESLASFTTGDLYDHHDADGFINLFGLPLKVRAMKMQEVETQKK